jgi:hypothetical protein
MLLILAVWMYRYLYIYINDMYNLIQIYVCTGICKKIFIYMYLYV